MKKIIFLFLLFICVNLYSETDKYSKELFFKDIQPLTKDVHNFIEKTYSEIDLYLYKIIIRNGDIHFLENQYLSDLQLGVLSKNELKILRNMYYAKNGYIFSDEDLKNFFKRYEWYNPRTKNVTFNKLEEYNIEKILKFEKENLIELRNHDSTITLSEFTGGADQEGIKIFLNKDKSFSYKAGDYKSRLIELYGIWDYKDKKIILYVSQETIMLDGYISSEEMESDIIGSKKATINYDIKPIIELPISNSKYEKYFGEDCITVGSIPFFIEFIE